MQGPREASSSNDWTLSCQSPTQAVGVEQLHGRWCPRVVLQAPGLHVHVGWGLGGEEAASLLSFAFRLFGWAGLGRNDVILLVHLYCFLWCW